MAVVKLPTNVSLVLEVQNGVNSDGDPKYTKRSFSGVKLDANITDVLAVEKAIGAILATDTNGCYLSETSLLANEEE